MKVLQGTFPGWLRLKVDFSELDIVKRIPIRRFDDREQVWHVPDTKRVRAYLDRCGFPVTVDPLLPRRLGQPRFKTDPRPHQIDDLEMMDGKHAFGVLDEPGMGKTKVIIDDCTRWFDAEAITGVIVVCPNSITGNWLDEISIHSPIPADTLVYDAGRSDAAKMWGDRGPKAGVLRWHIVASESMMSRKALDTARNFARRHRCLLVVDESTRMKNQKATRTKHTHFLAPLCPIRRILTGTMITKYRSLEGAWSQFEIIDPKIFNMGFYPYRGYFCVMGGYKSKTVIASMNEGDFFDIISPWVSLKKKKDWLNLPPKIFQTRKVAPSPEQRKLYNDVLSGVVQDPSFSVAMVRDLRLHQISGGFYYEKDTEGAMAFLLKEIAAITNGTEMPDPDELVTTYRPVPIPGPNPKVQEVLDIAEDIPGKMIVWFRYRSELAAVSEALRKEHGEQAVVEFHGGVDKGLRQGIIRSFQNDESVRFFLGQIHTGGIGITLTAASVAVFYSNDWPAEARIQAEDRIDRIGQMGEASLYIDLVLGDDNTPAGGFIDSRVLRAVQQGKDYHTFVQEEIQARQKNVLPEFVKPVF